MSGISAAVALLTALPLPGARRDVGAGLRWFSAVGLLLGGMVAGTWWLANQAWEAPLVPAAIAVALLATLTGMLHLDGLADAADAALVSADRERRLAILKDVHHGTFAIVAVAMVLLLKVSALAPCSARGGVLLLAIVPACSRAALPLVVRLFPTLPSSQMAAAAGATTPAIAIVMGVALVPAVTLLGAAGGAIALVCIITGVVTVGLLARRFGGINGDCLGAAVELSETAGLLAGSALLAHVHAGGPWGLP